MKYKGKTPEEIARSCCRALCVKRGLLALVCLLYFVITLWLIWWRDAGGLAILLGYPLLILFTVLIKVWISWGLLSLNRILNQDCDSVTYAEVCRLLGQKRLLPNRLTMAVNEAVGTQWCGRFSEALDMVDRLALPGKAVSLQLLARNIRFNCFAKLGDLETARRVREETARYAGTIRKPALRKQGIQLLKIMDSSLALYEGDYETFRRLEEELSTGYTANIQRVSSALRLARVDLAQGEVQNARSRLEMAAEQGGTLYLAEEARQLLAELERTE